MASLCAFLVLPNNFAAAEEIENDEIVLPSESNQGELQYGELVDYFVTAERIPTHRLDTPANVTAITAAEIEANHYQDLEEALSHHNGIGFSRLLNGTDRVLILINGRRLVSSQETLTTQTAKSFFPIPTMKNIERIEIVKGGYSALYGSDAAGGVINIITKKGRENETTLDINYGSWNRQNYELTNQGTYGENFGWFISGGLHKSDNYKYDGGKSDDSNYNNTTFSARIDNRFDENNSLTMSFLYRNDKSNKDLYNGSYDRERRNNFILSYNFKEDTSTPSWLRYFNNYESDYLYGDSRLQGVEYQNGWEVGQHKFILGFEYHKSKYTSEDLNVAGATMRNIAAYFQDTMSLGKWTVIPGIRFDYNRKPKSYIVEYGNWGVNHIIPFIFGGYDYEKLSTKNWSPKLALNYRADDKTKIYASWGKIFRAPTIGEYYVNNRLALGGFIWDGYNARLDSETGHTEIIGFEHDFNENTAVNVNFFNNSLKDVIRWRGIPVYSGNEGDDDYDYVIKIVPSNSENQKQRGIDVSFQQKLNDQFSYDLGFTHTHHSGLVREYFQPNGYRFGLHYKNRKFKANLLGIFASGLDTNNYYDSGSYTVLDFNTAYDITENATVYARALNFTNENNAVQNRINHSPGRFYQIGAQFKF